jgi:hypothetical protein
VPGVKVSFFARLGCLTVQSKWVCSRVWTVSWVYPVSRDLAGFSVLWVKRAFAVVEAASETLFNTATIDSETNTNSFSEVHLVFKASRAPKEKRVPPER